MSSQEQFDTRAFPPFPGTVLSTPWKRRSVRMIPRAMGPIAAIRIVPTRPAERTEPADIEESRYNTAPRSVTPAFLHPRGIVLKVLARFRPVAQ